MKRNIPALFLAAFASISSAQVPEDFGFGGSRASNWQDCPAGTSPNPYYKWQDGRFVRDGWDCRRIPPPV
jgi:hypothetical protein